MTDINELFNRDPLELTDDDIGKIIKEFREKRAAFNSSPAKTKKAPAPKTATQKAASKLDLDFKL